MASYSEWILSGTKACDCGHSCITGADLQRAHKIGTDALAFEVALSWSEVGTGKCLSSW